MKEYVIGPLAQIPPGEGRNFMVGDRLVAVFHVREGEVHATQAACPHNGGPLADGLTDRGAVICPLHDHAFSFATGEGIGNGCSIAVYPVRVAANGTVVLSLQT
jgi:nitrite reductase [NAD(P)H] small subunit